MGSFLFEDFSYLVFFIFSVSKNPKSNHLRFMAIVDI